MSIATMKEEIVAATVRLNQAAISKTLSFIALNIVAMSSNFYKCTLLTFYMHHETELDVSFNLIYSFPMTRCSHIYLPCSGACDQDQSF